MIRPVGLPGIELGWIIAPEFQRQGFATGGARALLAHAFNEMEWDHVISAIHPENEPSIRGASANTPKSPTVECTAYRQRQPARQKGPGGGS
jgi:hypothetical protein